MALSQIFLLSLPRCFFRFYSILATKLTIRAAHFIAFSCLYYSIEYPYTIFQCLVEGFSPLIHALPVLSPRIFTPVCLLYHKSELQAYVILHPNSQGWLFMHFIYRFTSLKYPLIICLIRSKDISRCTDHFLLLGLPT